MELLTLQDVVPLSTYRKNRDPYVKKMIAYKAKRRVSLAEHVSLLFENRQTVLFQVLELVHSEDLTDQREIAEYLDIYNPMIPGEQELSATLFIEADNQALLERLLTDLRGIEHHLYLVTGDKQIQGVFEEEHTGDVTSSVHYLKFPLDEQARNYLCSTPADQANVRVVLTHPKLSAELALPPEIIASLREDLRDSYQH
ncbi:fructose-bisphosphate aldolase [Collibacillus ludicampi]|uniref:Fructose-bisphosphate aldolase n=1 Tax=Collibacillus ludicampi TaxID=2771369 RepID=A0AAV4LBW9_9BACL|nr:DUF3501 family protein [Collibacillus ludicampi]GIM45154.1 fructose-bisphosphate aldolase [Collibacillus ludicampi]